MKFQIFRQHKRTILATFFSIILTAPAFGSAETPLSHAVNINQNQLHCRLNKIEGSEPNFFGRRHPQLPIAGDEIQIDFTGMKSSI